MTITCPHYAPPQGEKRCNNYNADGTCKRPDEFACTEWLKRQPSAGAAVAPVLSLLDQEPRAPAVRISKPAEQVAAQPPPPVVIRDLTEIDADSFAALGVEIHIESGIGPVWIVPEYTDADRVELTVRHASMLAAICAVFPAARVEKVTRKESEI
jgi:hypothetical protein